MALVHNAAKRKLRQGDIALGFGLHHLRSSAAPMLAAAGDHDFLFMDMEHGAFTVQEATQICIASLCAGIAPIVRVCAGALDEATRLLDNGALGIVVPHVDTKQQAQRIADAFHYPPMGHRSWGGPPPAYAYMPPHVSEAQKAINDEVLTVVMIESPEAVQNADVPIMSAYLLLVGFIFVVINLIVDLLYLVVDPRVRVAAFKLCLAMLDGRPRSAEQARSSES